MIDRLKLGLDARYHFWRAPRAATLTGLALASSLFLARCGVPETAKTGASIIPYPTQAEAASPTPRPPLPNKCVTISTDLIGICQEIVAYLESFDKFARSDQFSYEVRQAALPMLRISASQIKLRDLPDVGLGVPQDGSERNGGSEQALDLVVHKTYLTMVETWPVFERTSTKFRFGRAELIEYEDEKRQKVKKYEQNIVPFLPTPTRVVSTATRPAVFSTPRVISTASNRS